MLKKCCPVCGSRKFFDSRCGDDLTTCARCFELLYPRELVWLKTRLSRKRYAKANGYDSTYGTEL